VATIATKLFLRNSSLNPITDSGDAILYDLLTTAGAASDTAVVDTAASGTEIQWTDDTTGDQSVAWISPPLSAGFTLTFTNISVWCHESNMFANCGGRFRVFKYSGGTVTEVAGGPFDDASEFGTAAAEMQWVGDVTNTAFSAGDRILLRVYITNVGTMESGYTCTLTYNAADAATGDSFFNLAETVTFDADATDLVIQDASHAHVADSPTLVASPAIQDSAHAHTADNIALTQVHNLVIQDASHAHAVDNVVLDYPHLVIQDASHAHSADSLALSTEGDNVSVFTPPSINDTPTTSPEPQDKSGESLRRHGSIPNHLMRYFQGAARGRNVIKEAGVYYTVDEVSQARIDAAQKFYAGGHSYELTPEEQVELTEAGYAGNIT